MVCGWEGNRKSGVAHYKFYDISSYGLHGVRNGDEHPAYPSVRSRPMAPFIFFTTTSVHLLRCIVRVPFG